MYKSGSVRIEVQLELFFLHSIMNENTLED